MMPEEVVRTMICRGCRQPFETDKVGRGAWYCHRPECDEALEERRRQVDREGQQGRRAVRRRAGLERTELELDRPLYDELLRVVPLAQRIPPVERELKVSVRLFRERPCAFAARRLAAVALAVAADLAEMEAQMRQGRAA